MAEQASSMVARVFRFDPATAAAGYFEEFQIASAEPLSVMALLAKVHDLDPTFACRTSTCFKGICGSCLVRVNGEDVFGCVALVHPGETVVIEPHAKFKRVRDVVVDFSQPLTAVKGGEGR